MSGLSRLVTELWAGCDDGSCRPVSTLRAVLRCGDPRDSLSSFPYVSEHFSFHLFFVSCGFLYWAVFSVIMGAGCSWAPNSGTRLRGEGTALHQTYKQSFLCRFV